MFLRTRSLTYPALRCYPNSDDDFFNFLKIFILFQCSYFPSSGRCPFGQEPGLSNKGGYDRRADHDRYQDRVLNLVDYTMCQTIERSNTAEGQPGGHEQGCVVSLSCVHLKDARQWPDTQEFR